MICKQCGQDKPEGDFKVQNETINGVVKPYRRRVCRGCINELSRQYRNDKRPIGEPLDWHRELADLWRNHGHT